MFLSSSFFPLFAISIYKLVAIIAPQTTSLPMALAFSSSGQQYTPCQASNTTYISHPISGPSIFASILNGIIYLSSAVRTYVTLSLSTLQVVVCAAAYLASSGNLRPSMSDAQRRSPPSIIYRTTPWLVVHVIAGPR